MSWWIWYVRYFVQDFFLTFLFRVYFVASNIHFFIISLTLFSISQHLFFRVEKEAEPKIPKKRGPKPKIKLDENGEPIDPNSEKKPKR